MPLTQYESVSIVSLRVIVKHYFMLLGGKELVVKLLLLWKQNAYIEYTATAVSIISKCHNSTPVFWFISFYELIYGIDIYGLLDLFTTVTMDSIYTELILFFFADMACAIVKVSFEN